MEAAGFRQRQDIVQTLEPTSVAKTAEPGAAKPAAGKATGLSMPFPTDATINLD